jgi:replicative DNA helicase
MNRTQSLEIESQFLATLLNHPDNYCDIAQFISEEDFCADNSYVNRTIFTILKNALDNSEVLDPVVLTERLNSVGASFKDNINTGDYIQSLSMRKTKAQALLFLGKQLRSYTVRRDTINIAEKIIKKCQNDSIDKPFSDFTDECDKIYNDHLNIYDNGQSVPENLFSDMEEVIEERGNNPVEEFGLKGPHPRLSELYGSLLRAGNISCITARSGVGKTQFCLDFCLKASLLNGGVPVLHFDNGEMSKSELQGRLCSALSGVSLHLIETGKWKQHADAVAKLRKVWPKVKNYNLHYFNVAGLSVDQMISIVKRFYYGHVGRGNQMIFNFDYIKTTSEKMGNKNEWQIVGEMVDKFKQLVQHDVCFDGEPMISMMTSVQTNRQGISRNRSTENIVEDESIVSMSDRILQFCSHLLFLRPKNAEEMAESPDFGTHKLTSLKARFLGPNPLRAKELVRVPDSTRMAENALFFSLQNFNATEVGDLHDYYADLEARAELNPNTGLDELPNI